MIVLLIYYDKDDLGMICEVIPKIGHSDLVTYMIVLLIYYDKDDPGMVPQVILKVGHHDLVTYFSKYDGFANKLA
jgi:hypothetical protein